MNYGRKEEERRVEKLSKMSQICVNLDRPRLLNEAPISANAVDVLGLKMILLRAFKFLYPKTENKTLRSEIVEGIPVISTSNNV